MLINVNLYLKYGFFIEKRGNFLYSYKIVIINDEKFHKYLPFLLKTPYYYYSISTSKKTYILNNDMLHELINNMNLILRRDKLKKIKNYEKEKI